MEQQLRFAVHRPGNPVASPRSHGVPRRDIPGRVHISVAGETAGSAPEDGLTLTRVPVHLPARRAPLARERGSDLLHPARAPFPPAGAPADPTRTAGCPGSARPWPDVPARVLPRAFRGAGHVRDLQVLGPDQVEPPREIRAGLLRPVLTPVRLPGAQPGDRVLDPAAAVRSPLRAGELRCSRRSLVRSRALRPGQCSKSPVDRAAATATPRSMPTAWPLPVREPARGTAAKATCQRPARSIVTR